MPIDFKSETKTVEVLTARGKPVSYEIEYRWDPLTLRVSVICSHLKEKWAGFYDTGDADWFKKTVAASKENCPFCPPVIDEIAAKFSRQQMEEETLKYRGIYVFPNLYPRTAFEAVVASPDIHFLELGKLDKDLICNFLTVSIECLRKAYKKNGYLLYPAIGCNYLPPAGASLMHFHLQISMQEFPFDHLKGLIDSTARYAGTGNGNFWLDLMKINGSREIKRENSLYWYTPFAPAGFCEVRAIVNRPNILEFTAEDVKNLAEGLSNILRYYNHRGFAAFNYVIYSGRLDAENGDFLSGLHVVARPNPRPNYTSIDSWYMPFLLGQTIVLEKPEDLARELRGYF